VSDQVIMSSPNQHIIDALTTIADSYKNTGVVHKYKTYRNAIETIRNVPTKITSAASIKGMKGIGKAMLEKVDEICRTGHLHQEDALLADPVTAALKIFTSVHGVGPKLADKLVHEHGLRTLKELEEKADIVHLPAQARLGLKYHADTSLRIPYGEIRKHFRYISRVVRERVDQNVIIEVCGSHRRGAATSGDVDILLTHPHSHSKSTAECLYLRSVVRVLTEEGYILDTLAEGPSKFMGYCRANSQLDEGFAQLAAKGIGLTSTTGAGSKPVPLVRRLDIRWIPFDSFYPSLLYFTGSDMFNVWMRTEALKLGYTINEYGIYRLLEADQPASGASGSPSKVPITSAALAHKGERIEVESEEDIFRILGLKYVGPKQRNR
jgi:DNA polymerase/3'-5' exonuclease PolX